LLHWLLFLTEFPNHLVIVFSNIEVVQENKLEIKLLPIKTLTYILINQYVK
jgi:hypothetical protein